VLSALSAKQGLSLRQLLLDDFITEGTFSTAPKACGYKKPNYDTASKPGGDGGEVD